jgi:hypothetical protein
MIEANVITSLNRLVGTRSGHHKPTGRLQKFFLDFGSQAFEVTGDLHQLAADLIPLFTQQPVAAQCQPNPLSQREQFHACCVYIL